MKNRPPAIGRARISLLAMPTSETESTGTAQPGPLALIGGAEWQQGCEFDSKLLERGGGEVLVLPTAAAYEHPQRAVEFAQSWFSSLGGHAEGLNVLTRPDAMDPRNADKVRAANFIYLSGGSPLHLRSVLKGSVVWEAIAETWRGGAILAGSSAGAMVLGDPMVDPRGGAFTLGLGLVDQLAVMPHYGGWSEEKARRTVAMAVAGLVVAGIEERTALIWEHSKAWRVEGSGEVVLWQGGKNVDLDALPPPHD